MKKGLTVIELLLVISLIMVISLVSAGFYSRFLTQNAVQNTTAQIVGQMRKAQIYAMMGKRNSNWGINYSGQVLTLYTGNSFATRTPGFDENFTINSNINVSNLTDVNFTKVTGVPSSTSTIGVAGNNTAKSISVNTLGVVSR